MSEVVSGWLSFQERVQVVSRIGVSIQVSVGNASREQCIVAQGVIGVLINQLRERFGGLLVLLRLQFSHAFGIAGKRQQASISFGCQNRFEVFNGGCVFLFAVGQLPKFVTGLIGHAALAVAADEFFPDAFGRFAISCRQLRLTGHQEGFVRTGPLRCGLSTGLECLGGLSGISAGQFCLAGQQQCFRLLLRRAHRLQVFANQRGCLCRFAGRFPSRCPTQNPCCTLGMIAVFGVADQRLVTLGRGRCVAGCEQSLRTNKQCVRCEWII